MSERPNEPVLKTGVGLPTVGSNPTPSAREKRQQLRLLAFFFYECKGSNCQRFLAVQTHLWPAVTGDGGNALHRPM